MPGGLRTAQPARTSDAPVRASIVPTSMNSDRDLLCHHFMWRLHRHFQDTVMIGGLDTFLVYTLREVDEMFKLPVPDLTVDVVFLVALLLTAAFAADSQAMSFHRQLN